ncbi:MAG: TetR/AcrR family transcriptional regulator, transcriptional repressor for nem operon [Mycobacterium sp.]|jgi:TetR/AcrR family transcriptional repressor of nem operon|nr:TetR/AcrR family transcriptional regulator, transcriptional repressor for nem operon [Mycobacterium sp.]MDT5300066.1 TetR/AcrR family transcriptional regulator, transcriptional repressor for nem operon [Mycobacterium sp.]MDT5364400.1 TetR/AcrR family transcriptional regulator, transcriptional repressor for nem operon [Mycobacterium sp.]
MPRPRKFDEDTVVAAARDRFWNGGYAATSVDDLTAATGLGKGSLYGAFGDKHALFVRALDGYCVDAMDRVAEQLRQPGVSAYDRLAGHVRTMVADIVADNERLGCMMAKSSAELGAADADVDRVVGESLTRWRGDLVECIAEAQRDGTVRADADPEALATTLLGLIRGFEALRKGGTEPAQIAAAAEQALALVVG